ncbi:hypothetical protein, partial [Pseudomonas aeruginosa]|uniref:hypothetical protein n=1 Tax=Pseudomonas aeruginosa TaxID=287 RepID=UPI001C89C569
AEFTLKLGPRIGARQYRVGGTFEGCHVSLLSLNQTEKIDHELQASACRIESLSEQWLTFQMNEFSPYLGMTPRKGAQGSHQRR